MINQNNFNSTFHHISFRTTQYDLSVKFYETMGFKHYIDWVEEGQPCCFFDMGNGPFLELHGCTDAAPVSSDIHLCVHVDDVDSFYELAIKNRATPGRLKPSDCLLICNNGKNIDARIAFIRAPGGEEIEIICWKNFAPQEYEKFEAANYNQ